MDYLRFKKTLDDYLNYINETVTDGQAEKLFFLMNNLLEWNNRINLTAIKNEKDIILKHFVDSIYLKKYLNGKVLDIGSGAGFPGIPLAIINDKLLFVSIDSVNKKISFQKDTIDKLNLENIESIHCRAENLAQDKKYREKFDFVVSRAVANMTTLVEYMIPFLKIGGKCLCMKGPNAEEEIEEAKKAIKLLGGKIEEVKEYKISEENERTLVIITKMSETPKEYPRGQGKPIKNPIK